MIGKGSHLYPYSFMHSLYVYLLKSATITSKRIQKWGNNTEGISKISETELNWFMNVFPGGLAYLLELGHR